jgi:hypothetical protein
VLCTCEVGLAQVRNAGDGRLAYLCP